MPTQKKSVISSSKKTAAVRTSAKVAAPAKSVSAKKLASLGVNLSNHNQTSLRIGANHNQVLL